MAKAVEDGDHPCASIVRSQDRFDGEFQPPTPWVGRLSEASILFIGSNPSIGGKEFYPTSAWNDEDLIDFFDYAFEGHHPQIRDGIYARQADGTYGKWVRTWAGVRKRAEELLERTPVPGRDYAMTEVVHCRSQREKGVNEARTHCADLYLERTIAESPAKVVVALGAHVRQWLRSQWNLGTLPVSPLSIADRTRLVAFLPHPTSFGPTTFESVMPEELPRLRRALA